jgi:alpha-beta hydrolase superfamily lysophospholipase
MRKFLIVGIFALVLAGEFWFFSEPDIPRAVLEAKYASPPSQFLTLPDGIRAHVRDRGPRDALPLVLIHGSNASLYTWEPWVKRLSDKFRVITVDLPGHGDRTGTRQHPGTGHVPQEEVPDQSAPDVRAFLSGDVTVGR